MHLSNTGSSLTRSPGDSNACDFPNSLRDLKNTKKRLLHSIAGVVYCIMECCKSNQTTLKKFPSSRVVEISTEQVEEESYHTPHATSFTRGKYHGDKIQ